MSDPFDLERFVQGQAPDYDRVLLELRNGKKRSHWMWYIFPQFHGLGRSPTSQMYSIKSAAEALEYLHHPVLGSRLHECATIVCNSAGRSAREIFGVPDDLKLRSSATLFANVSKEPVFQKLLDIFFDGKADEETIKLLNVSRELK